MSGAVAFEGEINSIVKEYLSYNGFEKAVHSFETECAEKGTPVASLDVRPKTGRRLANIQQQMMQYFENGSGPEFFELWMTHLPQDLRDSDAMAPRLEFLLNVYFTIYPFRIGIEKDNEKYTTRFRQYLETRGNQLSRTPEFVSYCALAFIKDPRQVPSFSELFSESWTEAVRKRLANFLSSSLRSKPQPRLVQLLHGNGSSRDVQQLEQRVKESEKTSTLYRKRCTRVQNDYYNLIEITANLVDTLEQCIEGKPVALDYIPQICNRLFANNVRQTMDFSRPGTAGKTLRETVPSQPVRTQTSKDVNLNSSLDFNKIKSDLVTAGERKRALLLQALRWKLTRASYSERMTVLTLYRTNDIIGCTTPGPIKFFLGMMHASGLESMHSCDCNPAHPQQAVLDMVSGESQMLKQSLARLLNTIASSWEGRGYLALSNDLVMELIKGLQRSAHEPVSQEHILACLQKLSLRSNLRPMMINEGLISWLVTGLKSYHVMSDYMLEYSIALLMNLTIQSYGRNRCVPLGSQLLKIISNLLDHENLNIRPFVHGTLYSLLHIPSISEEARAMGMEEILTSSVKHEDDEEKKHVLFLIKRLNTFIEEPDHSNDSDDDDDDDVYEEDQEELEKDLDNDDVLKQQAGELSGNQFLAKYYGISDISGHQKNRLFDNVLANDEILRRPVTPGYMRSNTDRFSSIENAAGVRASYLSAPPGPRSQRPPTRSGSRPSSRDEVLSKSAPRQQQQQFMERQPTAGADHPFVSRPKIMRTPEPFSGRPSSRSHELMSPLQPKFSDSLPRPGSGGGRSSSQSSLRLK